MFDNNVVKLFGEIGKRRSLLLPAAVLATSVGCSSMQAAEEVDTEGPESNDYLIKVYFKNNCPNLLEVSIGHALVVDSLYFGLKNAIQMYQNELKRV